MNPLRLLIWLRLRQWQYRLIHLLRLFGYNPDDRSLKEFFYTLYLIAFFSLYFVPGTWGAIVYAAAQLGAALSLPLWEQAQSGIPWLWLLAATGLSLRQARQTPIALSFPDMAYVAGSPAPRGIVTAVEFGQAVLRAGLVVMPLSALAAVTLAQPVSATAGLGAAIRAVMATVPLLTIAVAIAWIWGLFRIASSEWGHWPGYGWSPLLLLLAGLAMPQAALWPGRVWLDALLGAWTAGQMALLGAAVIALLAALVWLGNRANLIDAADESAAYAQVQALGAFARLSPALRETIRSVQRQESLTGKRPSLHLPASSGMATLLFRSGLSLLRQGTAPFSLALWGAFFTSTAQIILSSGAPPEFWGYWLAGVLLLPPRQLTATFRADLREPFLRQFLPLPLWELLVADTAVPLACLLAGGLGVWLINPVISPTLIVLTAILVLLSRGMSLLHITAWRVRIPYVAAAFVTVGAVITTGLFWNSGVAAAAAMTAVAFLSAIILNYES